MRCKRWNKKISVYLDGELTPDEVRDLEQHLGRCRRCSSAIERDRRLAFAVARLPRAKAPEGLPAAIIEAVEAAQALPCKLVRQELFALTDGELEPAQQRVVRAHLALCPTCAQFFSQVTATKEATRRSLAPVRAPRRLVGDIFAATTRQPQPGLLERLLSPHQLRYALAGAAVVAALALIVFYLPRGGQIPAGTKLVQGRDRESIQLAQAPASLPAVQEKAPVSAGEFASAAKPGGALETNVAPVPEASPSRPSPTTPAVVRIVKSSLPHAQPMPEKSHPAASPVSTSVLEEGTAPSSASSLQLISSETAKPPAIISVVASADFAPNQSGERLYKVPAVEPSGGAKPRSAGGAAPLLIKVAF